jgi:hypothetical protein
MKNKLLFVIIFLFGLLTACNNSVIEEDGGPRYTGEIIEIDSANKKILMKGNRDYQDFWLTITDRTELSTTADEKLTFDDLIVGQLVDTWFTGLLKKNSAGKFTPKEELKLAFLQVKK